MNYLLATILFSFSVFPIGYVLRDTFASKVSQFILMSFVIFLGSYLGYISSPSCNLHILLGTITYFISITAFSLMSFRSYNGASNETYKIANSSNNPGGFALMMTGLAIDGGINVIKLLLSSTFNGVLTMLFGAVSLLC